MIATNRVNNVRIPVDLIEEVRCLPLKQQVLTKRIHYIIRLGIRYHAILELAAQKNEEEVHS